MDISNDAVRRELREIDAAHNASLTPSAELIDRLYQTEADEQTKFDLLVGGANRTKYLKIGGVAVLTSAVLAACGSNGSTATSDTTVAGGANTTAAGSGAGDIKVLQFAASLENLAVAAYKTGAPLIKDPTHLAIATLFLQHHTDHAALFNGAIKASGGKEITEPNSVYLAKLKPQLDALKDEAGVLNFALTVETGAASTYFSTVPLLTDPKLGATAMTVGATEYRHAALLSAALMKPITSTMKGFLTTAEAFAPAGV